MPAAAAEAGVAEVAEVAVVGDAAVLPADVAAAMPVPPFRRR